MSPLESTASPHRPLRWAIAPHVRACSVDGQVVLLDLSKGRYRGVSPLPGLADRIQGWPATDPDACATGLDAKAPLLIERLSAEGLITPREDDGRASVPAPHLEQPRGSMNALASTTVRWPGPRWAGRFLLSGVRAAIWLRTRTLLSMLERIERRRHGWERCPDPVAPETLQRCVARYEYLRPLAFTARDECLFDSLALLLFLKDAGRSTRLVIGVKVNPFAAHAWLQAGGTVLNGQRDRVLQFRPILVI